MCLSFFSFSKKLNNHPSANPNTSRAPRNISESLKAFSEDKFIFSVAFNTKKRWC